MCIEKRNILNDKASTYLYENKGKVFFFFCTIKIM